jgi:hypothetical protein
VFLHQLHGRPQYSRGLSRQPIAMEHTSFMEVLSVAHLMGRGFSRWEAGSQAKVDSHTTLDKQD